METLGMFELDVDSSYPGAARGPKGAAVLCIKREIGKIKIEDHVVLKLSLPTLTPEIILRRKHGLF
ncbi:hypothetical protein BCR33DRAFT_864575 [Rhizoclosmatium globosum]|uniref:Uncharacterized protein n=1 Tax=Rhizoclosmatium globosum TaxID=329046 RepID=A0A1Y1ZLP7_9FUNG|nr:hypothetical protein BCR33DRAFT_864575 [Rhizoclosmatium globosum]|eukprot:ORY11191.1 hypothetical protein BCR33DRAFT_864575 [Rhizoclosmatium globosum]